MIRRPASASSKATFTSARRKEEYINDISTSDQRTPRRYHGNLEHAYLNDPATGHWAVGLRDSVHRGVNEFEPNTEPYHSPESPYRGTKSNWGNEEENKSTTRDVDEVVPLSGGHHPPRDQNRI